MAQRAWAAFNPVVVTGSTSGSMVKAVWRGAFADMCLASGAMCRVDEPGYSLFMFDGHASHIDAPTAARFADSKIDQLVLPARTTAWSQAGDQFINAAFQRSCPLPADVFDELNRARPST